MDVAYFVARRKAKGYSQAALAAGICTQSTLSKFETNYQIPSLPILRQLCARLDLTLDDLDDRQRQSKAAAQQLTQAEEALMVEDYPAVQKSLAHLTVEQLPTVALQMQYHYLNGLWLTLTNGNPTAALFSFTQILDQLDEAHTTQFTTLAYLGEGILYARQNELAQAEFFLTKVKQALSTALTTVVAPGLAQARLLTMMYYLAEDYYLRDDFAQSQHYVSLGLAWCRREHVTYFLPRLKFLRAQNLLAVGAAPQQVVAELVDARAFARLNDNQALILQTTALINHYQAMLQPFKQTEGGKDGTYQSPFRTRS